MKQLFVICMLVSLLSAQVRIGVHGGISASSLAGKKGSALTDYADNSYGYQIISGGRSAAMLTKLTWGVSLELPLSSTASIITGGNFIKRGCNFEENLRYDQQYNSPYLHYEWLKQTWIEIPLLYNHQLYQFRRFSIDIQGGFWGAFRLDSEEYQVEIKAGEKHTEVPVDEKDRFFSTESTFDMGIQAALPLAFTTDRSVQFSLIPSVSIGFIPQVEYSGGVYQVTPDPENLDVIDTLTLEGGEENQLYDFRVVGSISFPIGDGD